MYSNETIENDRPNWYPCNQEIFKYWAQQRYWKIEEGILLLLGEEPNDTVITSLKKQIQYPLDYQYALEAAGHPKELSPILVEKFKKFYDTAQRYVENHDIYNPSSPTAFLAWVQTMDHTIQPELLAAVEKFHGQILNYKELYQQAQEEIESLKKGLENDHIKQPTKDSGENPPSTRSKNTYLKIILSMAIKKYNYAQNSPQRNTATGKNTGSIYSDIDAAGFSVSDNTIRDILKEAEELPSDK